MRTRHAFPTFRSIGLWFLLLLCQAMALAVSTPAQAHGDTVKVVVTGQREGHVTADITWENDGDAIDETVAATVNAVSPDGARSEGPWKLVRDTGKPAGWTTAEALPPGSWKVSVDVGFPALGHGDKEVAVPVVDPAPATSPTAPQPAASGTPDASATPSAAAPGASADPSPSSASSAAPHAAGDDDGGDGTLWWTTAGVAATALAGAAAGILLRRARARRLRS
ncbi:hypothetical protein OHU17_04130 [Streptomyces goshikiensis]|uniref:Uncharacterized protein n=1 Tax=Streptomyces goshikiensis TaxID=1942 RepID=A0ABZ1RE64_9ACTN|nr:MULTISPECIES: hypothetical protein [Streptomyces]OKI28140.1 hypothetical protein A6A28_12575 [Streptomyces sp. CB03578]PJN19879.1 hypothetical protein CG724_06560 [Streptomyces sp. CB02120-2]